MNMLLAKMFYFRKMPHAQLIETKWEKLELVQSQHIDLIFMDVSICPKWMDWKQQKAIHGKNLTTHSSVALTAGALTRRNKQMYCRWYERYF